MAKGENALDYAQIFKGGIPYGPDIKRLSEAFPVPELTEGLIISHPKLEAILEIARTSQRYYGVVNAWISKQKHDNGIIIKWQPSVGLKVLNPAEVLEFAETRTKQKAKQLGRSVKWFSWVDRKRLDDTGQKRLDHQMMVSARMAQAVASAQKELAVELAPIKSLPKRIAQNV